MNLVSDELKAQSRAALDDLHDSWSRPITIFKTATETIISTSVNYNPLFSNDQPDVSVNYTPVSGVFNARILYLNFNSSRTSYQYRAILEDTRFKNAKGITRLKLDPSGYDFIKDSIEVQFDGDKFAVITDTRLNGLFTPQYYEVWLVKNG